MSSTTFNITTTKQKLTRKLNILQKLIEDSNQYRPEWEFPSDNSELKLFVLTNQISLTKLRQQLDEQTEQTWTLYESSIQAIATMEEDKTLEETFNDYWEEKQGDKTISIATLLSQQLYKRLIELECQAAAFDLSQTNSVNQGNNNSKETNQESLIQLFNSLMIDQELFIGDIKLPEFHGNPSEFGPFWELFQELVHKQPFSNIRKLSILLSCCKGDAARCLQMIPRTADSYEKAIEQLKDQYEDPRRITIQMIRQLTSMKPCNNDPRSLRNNLNDIKAIIATLQKQGEMVDNSYMVTLVTETFSKPIQEEIASKQFDSGCQWTMEDLLVNLTTIIKRREFIESRNENPNEEHSVFHTRTRDQRVPYCIGCERAHAFENCDKYRTIPQMIGRLKSLGACWKCFDSRHKTKYCHMPDCANCGGHHNPILCQRESAKSQSTFQPPFQGQSSIPDTRERRWNHSTLPHTVMWRHHRPERNSQEDNNMQRPKPLFKTLITFPTKTKTKRNKKKSYVNFQLNLPSHPDTEVEFIDGITSNARLMVVPLKIQNKYINKREQVYALLDSASDQSFISSSLLERLHLIPRSEISITINTFGGHAEKKHVKRVEALLLNLQEQPLEVTLLTTNTISHAIPLLELNEEDKFFLKCNFPNLQEYWLHDATTEVVPDILLGMDYFNIILRTGEPLVQLPSGLHMTPTFFGHIICGAPHNKNTKMKLLSNKISNVNHTKCTNINHSQCTYNQTNFGYSNLRKLPNAVNEVLHTNDEPTKAPYYMPHQASITTTSTTTNTKIVRFYKMPKQPRLNDSIHKKPPLLANLRNILLKAKLSSKIMTAGMQKGSHLNSLQRSERDSVQFLRLMLAKQPLIPNNMKTFRFCRLPFNIKASPLLLGIPIHHRQEQEKEQNEPSLPASQLTLWKYWLTMAPTLTPIQATCPLSRHGPHLQFLTREINWQSLQQSERMQVYGIEYCIEKHEPDHKITAQLPFEVKLHTFHFTLESVIRKVIEAKYWAAPSSRNHDQMKCNFCIKVGPNPECRIRKASNVTTISIYAIVLTAYITSNGHL
ncbi:Tas retrotransposon peptidase A16 [Ostertagia ostertagi]